jgi:hypothetical protein
VIDRANQRETNVGKSAGTSPCTVVWFSAPPQGMEGQSIKVGEGNSTAFKPALTVRATSPLSSRAREIEFPQRL